MKTKKSILIFWALFLVPTVIMAAIAFRLLCHEEERLKGAAVLALTERARAVSDTIHLTVQAVQENLTASLLDIDTHSTLNTLTAWRETNPLIRNIFIFKEKISLMYPSDGMSSTPEERRFIARYASLFSGRVKFDFNVNPSPDEVQRNITSNAYPFSAEQETHRRKAKKTSRQNLIALARVEQAPPEDKGNISRPEKAETDFTPRTGWIPWFSENRLCILGWVKKQKTGPVYGVELELMTLLSRLVVDFPKLPGDNAALVLMDGNGNFMHQAGNLDVLPRTEPAAAISLSALLPHWQIAVFIDEKNFSTTRGFLYISMILLGIFITAIISGGALLTRLTLKNMADARQKTSFVSAVSHELKTPLTSIRMYAELLLSKRIKNAQKKERYLSVIVSESHRLTRLINNVLDFGKLEKGKKKYNITPVNPARLTDEIIDAHSIRNHNSGLEIIRNYEDTGLRVPSDRDALEQVILNLLDNALKYASDGKFIEFVLAEEEDFFLLKIRDNGPGIPKEHHRAIFENFHRVDNTLTSKHPGSGLGLSIARKILRDLGGDLVLEPMADTGCCFTARIKK